MPTPTNVEIADRAYEWVLTIDGKLTAAQLEEGRYLKREFCDRGMLQRVIRERIGVPKSLTDEEWVSLCVGACE